MEGLEALLRAARLPDSMASEFRAAVCVTGAVHVKELGREGWAELAPWAQLRPMVKRRVLQPVGP